MITGILGPRRVGKSTLVDHYISQYPKHSVVRLNMDKMSQREHIKAGQLEKAHFDEYSTPIASATPCLGHYR